MFGFVNANVRELTQAQKVRYNSVYCGICRQIRLRTSSTARLGLRYDMAFLALLHMSLYEPEETSGKRACGMHPIRPRPWVDSEAIQYAADMNVALAYYKSLDDWRDDAHLGAKMMTGVFGKHMDTIADRYPRQCQAIRENLEKLDRLEKENCADPNAPAFLFGQLMGELFVYREDLWASTLRKMGIALGRFIYLADAATDYRRDKRKKKYNPYLALGTGENWPLWEQQLVLAMARCTEEFERLPLVQDKEILNNILYSGVWCGIRRKKEEDGK
ncbi:MAG: hypothetical protein J6A88_10605 [Oscillospiraceae bacterium]|nr:hypothetical protein [Oscillospiraceae bacterium]